MRRYGFEFIKGSGADYNARNVIEAALFGGLICFSLLIILNSHNATKIISVFFGICFVYALFALFAEILPKTALTLSLLFSIFVLALFSIKGYQELTKSIPNTLNIINNALIIVYTIFVGTVNTHLLKKFFIKTKAIKKI